MHNLSLVQVNGLRIVPLCIDLVEATMLTSLPAVQDVYSASVFLLYSDLKHKPSGKGLSWTLSRAKMHVGML